jgi:3-phosphoshikimate 1-carboxyvinyltransferase
MPAKSAAPRPLAAERSPWLRGALGVPGDEMISALGFVLGSVARGRTLVRGAPGGARTASVTGALEALGVQVRQAEGAYVLHGLGVGGLLAPQGELDFGSSAKGLELTMGLVATHAFETHFTGGPALFARSFAGLLGHLRRFGTQVPREERGRLPIALRGAGIALPAALELAPAQRSTRPALLLAALGARGTSTITAPPGPNHAERLLKTFGADLDVTETGAGETIAVRGLAELRGQDLRVPGDTDLAALAALAASVVPGSELTIGNVLVNPRRTGLLSALVAMGADITARGVHLAGGEEVADLVVRHAGLKGVALAAEHVAPLLDQLPLLAVAAACADGESSFQLPADLPLIEEARIADLCKALRANGVVARTSGGALVVSGGAVPGGGRVVTDGDPTLGLAFLVLGMVAGDQVTIDDQTCIEERFPGFVDAFENVGASFIRYAD